MSAGQPDQDWKTRRSRLVCARWGTPENSQSMAYSECSMLPATCYWIGCCEDLLYCYQGTGITESAFCLLCGVEGYEASLQKMEHYGRMGCTTGSFLSCLRHGSLPCHNIYRRWGQHRSNQNMSSKPIVKCPDGLPVRRVTNVWCLELAAWFKRWYRYLRRSIISLDSGMG